ncbi:hypothetical protein H072_5741 [Dactylellina haptotyla CBS 200.50]|uniref:Uncharacterized protein n=1 Tax=Dactylellina haptotyla (strain CBS 200.50) TaxID=1284197 RepID=S8BLW4_DACHA|nr:hypothetical protein H072_5741 [Dactylellina haptotyla CBS 200.50]
MPTSTMSFKHRATKMNRMRSRHISSPHSEVYEKSRAPVRRAGTRANNQQNSKSLESYLEWRRHFFNGREFRALQDEKVRDLFNIPEHASKYPPRQDNSRTSVFDLETRDWYDFHFPTGIVLFPYDFTTISSSTTGPINGSQFLLKRNHSDKKIAKGNLNGISMSNYRRIQDLRRGDRVVLPNDSQISAVNNGIVPKGVLIVNRVGIQAGTNYAALQVRTFVQLQLYELVLPHHIRSLHLVETETVLMAKQSSSIPLPGYFMLRHAYLLGMEVDSWREKNVEDEDEGRADSRLFRFECAFLGDSGGITKQRFIAAETIHDSVNRLHVSWHVGQRARETDFVKSNKWVLWLLKYVPSSISAQAKHIEAKWTEAETYQVLGWGTSGVLATGSESLGAIQTEELTAEARVYEGDMFKVLSRQTSRF